MMDKNIHQGHRQRMKDRFVQEGGLDSFEDHQVLEMLLFYALPRRDTNEIAHKMIKEYGSLNNLLSASPSDIARSCNVSANTAVLISLVQHIAKRYLTRTERADEPVKSKKAAYDVIAPYFAGANREMIYLMCLDSRLRLIRVACISNGNISDATVNMQRLLTCAIENKAVFAIVVHNHPGGFLEPSSEDMKATLTIKQALQLVSINLIDHLIISDQGCYSFAQNELCGMSYK